MLIFVATEQKLHVSSKRTDRSRNCGWYARLVQSKTIGPIVEDSIGEDVKPKAGHVILALLGSSSSVIHKFCICGRENRTGT